ncbi:MAG: Fic family protein [Verrucomicrobiota bacterium]
MKIPQITPDWSAIIQQASVANKSKELFQFGATESARSGRYLHWDEFRHRVASDESLTMEEKWAAVRMSRAMRAQPISLTDDQYRPFTFFLTQSAFEFLHEIDLDCGGSIGVAADGLMKEEQRDRYYVNSLVEEALTSSQLEGAVVTRSEAKEMIRQRRSPATSHELMVMNNYRTMRLLSELKDEPLSEALILRIHREITAGTMDDPRDEGRFRNASDPVRVEDEETREVIHTPPPAGQLPARVVALCEFANAPDMKGFLHPVIRSIILHFWIAYDHPFIDGNGRTARALFYWSMLRHRYWLAEFFSISHEILKAPKKYYRAFLHTETDANDLNYFLLHQLHVIKDSIGSLKQYIRQKQSEVEAMSRRLGPKSDFNHRQLALLKHAVTHPFASYTVMSHQTSHGVANQTAKSDLAALETRGLLRKRKVGKAFVYEAVSGLAEKLGL